VRRFSKAALTALFLAAFPLITEARAGPIRYTLSPVVENGALKALAIDVDFEADADGLTRLRFVDRLQEETRPGRYAQELVITGGDEVTPLDGDQTQIRSAPGAALHARYRIRSGYDAPPTTQDATQTKPVILPDWFYALGELIFAFPAGRRDAHATFAWAGAPEGFRFASDLEQLNPASGTVNDVLDSIVAGSPRLRVIRGGGADAGVRVAVLGAYERFDDQAFADMAFRTIRTERAFWGDPATPFLVTLAPLAPRVGEAYSGTGRDDAFALWVGTSLPLADLRRLLAHEHFHTWNPGQLGRMGKDRSSAWLAEGFTDFYARRLLLRAGLYGLKDYAEAWNADLLAYAVSPAREAPEAKIAENYWRDRDLEGMSYLRGALMAALFDAELRRNGRGLDAVMRRMRVIDRKTTQGDLKLNFLAAFQAVAGRSPALEIERFQTRGETLTLPDDAFACLTLRTVAQPAFDVGFDLEATASTGVFAGVDPAGPAHAAGLRDGMRRLGREGGAMNDSSVEIVYRVADASGHEQVVRYRPEGRATVRFQHLTVPEALTPAQERACIRTLSAQAARR
jgi:predicted metalloprotease with PDZ domain